MNIMQGRILFKFQDLPERRLDLRSYHGLFGDLGRSYFRIIAANESTHVSSDSHGEGDKKKKPIGGEGETFPYCSFNDSPFLLSVTTHDSPFVLDSA
jgi:hypothetical protein